MYAGKLSSVSKLPIESPFFPLDILMWQYLKKNYLIIQNQIHFEPIVHLYVHCTYLSLESVPLTLSFHRSLSTVVCTCACEQVIFHPNSFALDCLWACARLYWTHTCILTNFCPKEISMNLNDIKATVHYLIVLNLIFLLTWDFIIYQMFNCVER